MLQKDAASRQTNPCLKVIENRTPRNRWITVGFWTILDYEALKFIRRALLITDNLWYPNLFVLLVLTLILHKSLLHLSFTLILKTFSSLELHFFWSRLNWLFTSLIAVIIICWTSGKKRTDKCLQTSHKMLLILYLKSSILIDFSVCDLSTVR